MQAHKEHIRRTHTAQRAGGRYWYKLVRVGTITTSISKTTGSPHNFPGQYGSYVLYSACPLAIGTPYLSTLSVHIGNDPGGGLFLQSTSLYFAAYFAAYFA